MGRGFICEVRRKGAQFRKVPAIYSAPSLINWLIAGNGRKCAVNKTFDKTWRFTFAGTAVDSVWSLPCREFTGTPAML